MSHATLTPAMAKAMRYLQAYVADKGYGPSFDDLREHLGLSSKSRVHRLLTALEQRGYIRRRPRQSRAFEILNAIPDPRTRLDRAARAVCAALGVSETSALALVRAALEKELANRDASTLPPRP